MKSSSQCKCMEIWKAFGVTIVFILCATSLIIGLNNACNGIDWLNYQLSQVSSLSQRVGAIEHNQPQIEYVAVQP